MQSDNVKAVEDAKAWTPERFVRAYEKLCQESGFQIVVSIAYKYSEDTRDFRTVVMQSVGKSPSP